MKTINLQDYDAIAFDVEGTLADTIPTHHAARIAAFKAHGYGHITREQHELGPTYGSSTPDIVGGVLHAAGAIEKTGLFKDHPVVKTLMAAKMELFEKQAAAGFDEMPAAADFVRLMSAQYPGKVALVTSSALRFVTPFLERYQLSNLFTADLIITEDTIVAENLEGKPAPDPYLLAIKRLNAAKLLVFEDTVSGVVSAKKAGATVIALEFEPQSAKQFASGKLEFPPDFVVKDYAAARILLGL